jgi:hypothetical protein
MGRCGSAAQMQMMGRSTFKEEGLGFLNSPHSRAAGTRNYVQQAFSTYANVQPFCLLPSRSLPGSKLPIEPDILLAISASKGHLWTAFRIPPPTHPCYKSSASILNQQEATSALPGSSLCDMSMEGDLQEAIIFDSAKIKGEFWIRRRELVRIQLPSCRRVIGVGISLHVNGLPLGRVS